MYSTSHSISTHTPAWGVTRDENQMGKPQAISTHTPAWGVTKRLHIDIFYLCISTHTPAWGVTENNGVVSISHFDFNSHARVGRDVEIGGDTTNLQNFNSHARVGRDAKSRSLNRQLKISTHTPAWGVTFSADFINVFFDFNSHARVGRDALLSCSFQFLQISTHTPAWGVTAAAVVRTLRTSNFNSHARVGRDLPWGSLYSRYA